MVVGIDSASMLPSMQGPKNRLRCVVLVVGCVDADGTPVGCNPVTCKSRHRRCKATPGPSLESCLTPDRRPNRRTKQSLMSSTPSFPSSAPPLHFSCILSA